ncbi:MAG: hypothetical protein ACRD3S_01100, partial [Terracidiphilus sp.]
MTKFVHDHDKADKYDERCWVDQKMGHSLGGNSLGKIQSRCGRSFELRKQGLGQFPRFPIGHKHFR